MSGVNATVTESERAAGAEVIEKLGRLPGKEQLKAVRFARPAPENRPLSPEQLGELAERMVKAGDPAEADRLQQEIVRGFYGGESHA